MKKRSAVSGGGMDIGAIGGIGAGVGVVVVVVVEVVEVVSGGRVLEEKEEVVRLLDLLKKEGTEESQRRGWQPVRVLLPPKEPPLLQTQKPESAPIIAATAAIEAVPALAAIDATVTATATRQQRS